MSTEDIEADEIDTETLQAQIDLSVSFAQDLVSSWIKPSVKLALPRRNDSKKELEDYMRRPPRLGVGAPLPESFSLPSESARLKARLINRGRNKRSREDDDDDTKELSSDNEEESRAGAIHKRAKVDPFRKINGKKKTIGHEVNGLLAPHRTSEKIAECDGLDVNQGPGKNVLPQEDISVSSPPQPPSPIRKKKKKKRKKLIHDASHTPSHALPTPKASVENAHDGGSGPHQISMLSHQVPTKVAECASVTSTLSATKPAVVEPRTPEPTDVSLIMTPKSLPRPQQLLTSSVFKFPVLNLNGPPPDGDDDSKVITRSESPRKKRKRKRKRKSSMVN